MDLTNHILYILQECGPQLGSVLPSGQPPKTVSACPHGPPPGLTPPGTLSLVTDVIWRPGQTDGTVEAE